MIMSYSVRFSAKKLTSKSLFERVIFAFLTHSLVVVVPVGVSIIIALVYGSTGK